MADYKTIFPSRDGEVEALSEKRWGYNEWHEFQGNRRMPRDRGDLEELSATKVRTILAKRGGHLIKPRPLVKLNVRIGIANTATHMMSYLNGGGVLPEGIREQVTQRNHFTRTRKKWVKKKNIHVDLVLRDLGYCQ